MKNRIAIITMVYNESARIPRWVKHYSSQANGAEHLYLVDHGSDDGSTNDLGSVNLIRIARSEGGDHYQRWRVKYVANLVDQLLRDYDYVMYSDCDELVCPDPKRYNNLYHYVSEGSKKRTHAIGFDVIHDLANEAPLDGRYVFEQRSKLQFVAAVCKPVLTASPIRWGVGFHSADCEPKFGDLLLFHMRYADLDEGLARLSVTRNLERPEHRNALLDHQKISDQTYTQWVKNWLKMETANGEIDLSSPEIKSFIDSFVFCPNEHGIYEFDYSFRSRHLFQIPKHFKFVV